MPHGLALATFEAVLFDVDGTLIDSLTPIVAGIADAYETFTGRRPLPEEILGTVGRPLPDQFGIFGHQWTKAELKEITDFTVNRFRFYGDQEVEIVPAVEALRLIKERGIRTALVTSKTEPELKDFLCRHRLGPWLDATVCASDVLHPKPDPESALRACELLNVPTNRTVMIGDSIYDLQCARRAGVVAVAVTYGAGKEQALAAESPDYLFRTPQELFHWVDSTFS